MKDREIIPTPLKLRQVADYFNIGIDALFSETCVEDNFDSLISLRTNKIKENNNNILFSHNTSTVKNTYGSTTQNENLQDAFTYAENNLTDKEQERLARIIKEFVDAVLEK